VSPTPSQYIYIYKIECHRVYPLVKIESFKATPTPSLVIKDFLRLIPLALKTIVGTLKKINLTTEIKV